MSEAGKDATARPQSTEGDSLPVRSLARVAPQSAQLAKDHALLGRSVWCGLVFALAVVITTVNFLPPAHVGYRVTTQVLVSPQRYESLKRLMSSWSSEESAAQLLSVSVLDDASLNTARRDEHDTETEILIEVHSLWPGRTDSAQLHRWLNSISQVDPRVLSQIDSARVRRFARWEVQAQQHYLNHHRQSQSLGEAAQLASQTNSAEPNTLLGGHNSYAVPPRSQSGSGSLNGSQERVPAKFASMSSSSGAPVATTATSSISNRLGQSSTLSVADVEKQLQQELAEARERELHAAQEVENQARKAAGTLTLSDASRVRAAPDRMPTELIVSMLILAIACGALGGWANHRALSGGTFSAQEVGSNMQLLGLPVLGHIRLPLMDLDGVEGEVARRLTSYRRLAIQKSLAISELVVLFWCLAIVIRLVLDPLWRALLWENPLAALARLFIGLP